MDGGFGGGGRRASQRLAQLRLRFHRPLKVYQHSAQGDPGADMAWLQGDQRPALHLRFFQASRAAQEVDQFIAGGQGGWVGCDARGRPRWRSPVLAGSKRPSARTLLKSGAKDCNWLDGTHDEVLLKFRSMMQPIPATLIRNPDGTATLALNEAQYGIAPGQAAVCYDGDRMIGGGWILSTENSALEQAA